MSILSHAGGADSDHFCLVIFTVFHSIFISKNESYVFGSTPKYPNPKYSIPKYPSPKYPTPKYPKSKIPNVPKYPRLKQQCHLNNLKRLNIKSTQNTWLLHNYLIDILIMIINIIVSYNKILYVIIIFRHFYIMEGKSSSQRERFLRLLAYCPGRTCDSFWLWKFSANLP